jgi:MFS family permease
VNQSPDENLDASTVSLIGGVHIAGAVEGPARPTSVRYAVLAWLCVATTIAYVDRGCLSVAEKQIRTELRLTESQMGLVMSAFFLTYAIFQVPGAWLDRAWGARRSLTFFAAAWSVATGLCGVANGFGLLLTTRLAMGAAEAGIFPSSTGALGRWFPPERRASVSGVLASFMGVGGAIGAALTGLVLAILPWRWMFAIYAVPGLLWAFGFAWWFRDYPRDHPAVNEAELHLIGDGGQCADSDRDQDSTWSVLRSRAVAGLVAQQFFRAAGAIFYISWFPTYLHETRGVGVFAAGVLSSLPHWAIVAGSLAGGWLSDRVLAASGSLRLARQGVAAASMAVAAVLIGLAYPVSAPLPAVLVLSAGAFTASMAGPCAYARCIHLGRGRTAQVFSVMNTAGAVGSVLFPVIAPRVVSATGSWDSVLVLFAGLHVAACACWLAFDADRRNPSTESNRRSRHADER